MSAKWGVSGSRRGAVWGKGPSQGPLLTADGRQVSPSGNNSRLGDQVHCGKIKGDLLRPEPGPASGPRDSWPLIQGSDWAASDVRRQTPYEAEPSGTHQTLAASLALRPDFLFPLLGTKVAAIVTTQTAEVPGTCFPTQRRKGIWAVWDRQACVPVPALPTASPSRPLSLTSLFCEMGSHGAYVLEL